MTDRGDETPFSGHRLAWALLSATGPLALGLAIIVAVPLALSPADGTWPALVALAGAGLFWWALMWIGRQVRQPDPWLAIPSLLMLAVLLGPPLGRWGIEFFTVQAGVASETVWSPAASLLPLDRELTLIALQKLVVAVLLAVPLVAAANLRPWTRTWFRVALLGGVAGLLAMAAMQLFPAANDIWRVPAVHAAGALSASACVLLGLTFGLLSALKAQWQDREGEGLPARLGGPVAPMLVLTIMLSLAAAALTVAWLAGPMRWMEQGAWAAVAVGLLAALGGRHRAVQWIGAAAAVVGLIVLLRNGPGGLIRDALAVGQWFGSADFDDRLAEVSGLAWLIEWRGPVGAVGVLLAGVVLAWRQLVAMSAAEGPQDRLVRGGLIAGSWLLAASWLIGPAHVNGSAAWLALCLWALSLADANGAAVPPRRLPANPFLVFLAGFVILIYGVVGQARMVHPPMWLEIDAGADSDKLLHGVWGLYVTLACVLAVAFLGRWPAVLIGGLTAVALAAGAEFMQHCCLPGRSFEWMDIVAFAIAATGVVLALLLAPCPWGGPWTGDRVSRSER